MEKKKTPALTQSLGERIAICAERMGGKRAMADACGLSESQIYRFISGDRTPSTAFLLEISEKSGTNAGWILSGEGSLTGGAGPRPPFRPELLTHLSRLLEESLQEQPFSLTHAQKAKALTFLYEAASFEEAPTGRPAFTSTSEIITALDYMTSMSPLEDGMDMHMQAMQYLEGWATPPPELYLPFYLQRWAGLVTDGQKRAQNGSLGATMYNMLGYTMPPGGGVRITNMVKELLAKRQVKELTVLDAGCGTGRELAYVHQTFPYFKLKGIDLSEQAIRMAQVLETNGKLPKNTVIQADICEIPFADNSFDLVYCRFTLAFLPIIPVMDNVCVGAIKAVRELVRILKPGGHIEIILPSGRFHSYLPYRRTYTKADVDKILEAVPEAKLINWIEPETTSFTYRFEELFTHRYALTITK